MIYSTKKEFLENCKGNTRLLGLDVGTKTIGVAISDKSRILSTPKETIQRKGNKKDIEILINIIEENKISGIIVGKPLNSEEADTKCSKFIENFVNFMEKYIDLPIFFVNEALTSFQAEDFLIDCMYTKCKKVKEIVDKVAASYILNDFLSMK